MAFKPFKVLTSILSSLTRPNTVLKGPTIPNFKTVASKKGIIDYNPTNADYSNPHHSESGRVFVYPTIRFRSVYVCGFYFDCSS